MHLCDKCVKFNKCFPKGTMPTEEKRVEVELSGCKDYRELTVEAMFMPKRKERK